VSAPPDPRRLPAFASGEPRAINVVIETARGSRNKFAWDEDVRLFRLRKVLPEGMAFPYDFGFVPSTLAEDGDPLDVLVLMDEPAFAGCLLTARVVGAILGDEAEPRRPRRRVRNDRLVAVALASRTHDDLRSLADLNGSMLDQVEAFFTHYQQTLGKRYRVRGRKGPRAAWQLVESAVRSWRAAEGRREGKTREGKRPRR
jgi:inorganic pyrophosphatase